MANEIEKSNRFILQLKIFLHLFFYKLSIVMNAFNATGFQQCIQRLKQLRLIALFLIEVSSVLEIQIINRAIVSFFVLQMTIESQVLGKCTLLAVD